MYKRLQVKTEATNVDPLQPQHMSFSSLTLDKQPLTPSLDEVAPHRSTCLPTSDTGLPHTLELPQSSHSQLQTSFVDALNEAYLSRQKTPMRREIAPLPPHGHRLQSLLIVSFDLFDKHENAALQDWQPCA